MGEDVKGMAQEVQDRIREVAYLMWEAAGRQHGMALEYWVTAEKQVLETMGMAAKLMSPGSSSRGEVTRAAAAKPAPAGTAQAASQAAAAGTADAAAQPDAVAETGAAATAALAEDIREIEGIGPAYAKKLASAGITSPAELLDACCTPKGRQETVDASGLSAKLILRWTNMADLMRIAGIDGNMAELLESSGVDSVKELRNRKPETLRSKMAQINTEKNLARRVPQVSEVAAWIDAARTLPPKLTY